MTNGVMMQFFHWYLPDDGSLWTQLAEESGALAEAGFTAVWLPPAYKGIGGANDVGYGVYDLFDLGEFNQKGSTRTKYGTKDEYVRAIEKAHENGMQVYGDIVFNHKMGADKPEEFKATPYNPDNRQEPIGELQPIKAWTHFTFPGRGNRYSKLKWHWWHFNAADHNAFDEDTEAVYLFEGKSFDLDVDREKGNFDYLMGCNLDINNEEVQKELKRWGVWYLEQTQVDGFRFDAVKHVRSGFFLDWLHHVEEQTGRDLFGVGEYWSTDKEALTKFLDGNGCNILLFDVILHYNFADAGKRGSDYDLREIFTDTLVQLQPDCTVTMVSNHDSQPLQALESVVEPWFKPLAYALILLRREGYPCVFYADYYGAHYKDTGSDGGEYEIWMESYRQWIDAFLHVRHEYAYGEQYDYFDEPGCIGWTRTGTEDHPGGLAVVMSMAEDASRSMQTASPNMVYVDATEQSDTQVTTDSEGWGDFPCPGGSVSVWIPAKRTDG